jgi:hypothetical protein
VAGEVCAGYPDRGEKFRLTPKLLVPMSLILIDITEAKEAPETKLRVKFSDRNISESN